VEQVSVREDDRPFIHPERNAVPWPVWLLGIIVLIAAGAGAYYYFSAPPEQAAPAPVLAQAPPSVETAAVAQPEPGLEPAIRHRLELPASEAPVSLPTLDNSDAMVRESLLGLMGGEAFAQMVIPAHLVRRIVATVDNLPRGTAPRRVLPLNAVPGAFAAAGPGEEAILDAANFKRYAPYVRVVEALNSSALVYGYVRTYPLFQRAYEELGYSGQYFNDRLVQAIDDMLAAPDIEEPVGLIRPKILYEFADPDLETRSAGQKIMIRMGPENASKVKVKLWEVRRELIAASERRSRDGQH
jgi:hypothetical protein